MAKTETVLVTIRISHYCEKARWALQRSGTPFRESAHAPGFHVPPARRAGGRSTPILVTPGGVFADSTDILLELDRTTPPPLRLYPDDASRAEVLALEDHFDEALGPHVRRYLYHYILADRALALRIFRTGVPAFERAAVPLLFPLLKRLMRRSMRIDDTGAERSREKVDAVFAQVSERLRDGRPYLVGERFTAADLTFAALAAPVVGPRNYGGELPPDDTMAPELVARLVPWRNTLAAEHVRRMYREHRDR